MDEVTPRTFNRKAPLEDPGHVNIYQGPSVEKMSQEFERIFAPPRVEIVDEEKKESDFAREIANPTHFLSSPKRGLMGSSNSAFTKPRMEIIEKEDSCASQSMKGTSIMAGSGEENNRPERKHHQEAPERMNSVAANAMAHHVVNKLQKEAAAMMAAGEMPHYRRASPIARMRESSFRTEGSTVNTDVDQPQQNEAKSDREVKEEKRRKWKQKAKIAKANQRRERRVLEECTVGSGHFGTNHAIIGCVLDNVEKTDLFKRLTNCGGGVYHRNGGSGEYEESEYGSASSNSEFYSEEYYHTEEDEETPRGRRRRQRRKKWETRSRDSSIDPSSAPSVDTTVLEETTTSFISTDDDGSSHEDRQARKMLESTKSVAATIGNRSVPTDYAFAGFSSLDNSKNMTNRNAIFRDTHMSLNHQLSASAFSNSIKPPSFVKSFIQDIESKGESMLWHQLTACIDPTTVIIRLKRGYRLPNGNYCAPRLIWTDLRNHQNYGFDVFDIRSLDHASALDLKDFPYAIPGRSAMLHLKNSTSFIFEAGTEEDVMKFVHGIRWVISRLTYNLVIGNLDMSCELFDLGHVNPTSGRKSVLENGRSNLSEFDWFRAMDDVTEVLIDRSLSSTFEV